MSELGALQMASQQQQLISDGKLVAYKSCI